MATATNLTLVGTAPASTTWTLMSRSSQEAVWQDRRRGIVEQFGTIKMAVNPVRDTNGRLSGKYKLNITYIEPIVRSVSGVEVTSDPMLAKVEFRLPGNATDAEKVHALKVLQSMIAHAIFGASHATGESIT